jgi:hypothetical protein
MTRVIKPPQAVERQDGEFHVFLAGTIDMGDSPDWQADMARQLGYMPGLVLLNPRRDDWDASWEQRKEHPEFRGQVTWELDNLAGADLIVMALLPGSDSPISLLELGLFADTVPMLVYCPEGFYRKGNVDIVCELYGVQVLESYPQLLQAVQDAVAAKLY